MARYLCVVLVSKHWDTFQGDKDEFSEWKLIAKYPGHLFFG